MHRKGDCNENQRRIYIRSGSPELHVDGASDGYPCKPSSRAVCFSRESRTGMRSPSMLVAARTVLGLLGTAALGLAPLVPLASVSLRMVSCPTQRLTPRVLAGCVQLKSQEGPHRTTMRIFS
jgi:hypothetical protein